MIFVKKTIPSINKKNLYLDACVNVNTHTINRFENVKKSYCDLYGNILYKLDNLKKTIINNYNQIIKQIDYKIEEFDGNIKLINALQYYNKYDVLIENIINVIQIKQSIKFIIPKQSIELYCFNYNFNIDVIFGKQTIDINIKYFHELIFNVFYQLHFDDDNCNYWNDSLDKY